MSTSPRLLGGRYEVGELIGRGGMAEVHLGHDARLGRPVAIKILRTDHARDADFLARFRREAQSVAGLNHPSIVAVYDSGEEHVRESGGAALDIPYIVMEYVDGLTLRELLNDSETGTLDPYEASRIVQHVLEALDYSHDMGIVHRDIKPGNVMVTHAGDVKVMDFGIARAIADTQATMTQTQAVIGTAQYISPEQARGETVDKRSDVYSTGCLLFELLTGRTPYTGEPISLTYQHVNADIPFPSSVNSDVPSELDAVVVHSLTKDRDDRYPDARAMAQDLAAFAHGRPISPVATSRLEAATTSLPTVAAAPRAESATGPRSDPDTASIPATTERRRNSRLGWLFAALLLIPLALLGWFAWSAAQGPPEVTVPKVVGTSEESATATLTDLGLEVDSRAEPSDKTVGQVTDQNPREGSTAREGDEVTLIVSAGPADVSVPNVVGMTRSEATGALEDVGLEVGDVTEEDSAEQGPDKVISVSPSVSETVSKGASVDLVVASGQVELKDYVGQDVSDVRSELYDLNLEVKEQTEESSAPVGTILAQNPAAGSVEQGTEVTFVIAEKAASTVTESPSSTSETSEPSDSESTSEESEPTSTDSESQSQSPDPSDTSPSPTGPDTGSSPRSTRSPGSP
ncbi:Stk1 family PASTA domain-containing Ser/Thr kinase [Janibacter cremeus]|uniref:non-specific serine/threonine protein kinase n=1 Tax=Janibacter cremeus TaxID=1285192 RepID=A0A852VU61_9MICO|nr:Stk1 family PASTA domain-containing Ser/Thr kinase [Janibacter cremeus]NYF98213.1 serine/threonine-protein kinase [Janibacter cremeus]